MPGGGMTEQGAIPVDDYAKISQTLKEVEDAPMTYDLLRVREWKGWILKKHIPNLLHLIAYQDWEGGQVWHWIRI
jgi:hypothetical protein